MANAILSGLAAIVVAGTVVLGMEKSGISQVEQEVTTAASEAHLANDPLGSSYAQYQGYMTRASIDCVPALVAGVLVYALLRRKD